jgi:hypothetical protein
MLAEPEPFMQTVYMLAGTITMSSLELSCLSGKIL